MQNKTNLDVHVGILKATGNPHFFLTNNGHCLRRKGVVDALMALQNSLADSLGEVLNPDLVWPGIETLLANPNLGHCVVAWGEHDQIFAQLEVKKIFEVWENSSYWYVDNYIVFPEYQRKGIGSKMLEFVSAQAALENVPRLRLFVNGYNADAKRFYVRHGFASLGEYMELPVKGPRRVDKTKKANPALGSSI